VTAPLKRLQTNATRIPRPTSDPRDAHRHVSLTLTRRGPTGLVSRRHRVLPASDRVALASFVDSRCERRRAALERHAFDDIQAEPPGRRTSRVIRHHPHRGDAEVDEDLCRRRTRASRPGDRARDSRRRCLGPPLAGRTRDLVSESDAAALVTSQVHDDAGAFGRDLRERRFQLRSAVTAHRTEHVAGQALGVNRTSTSGVVECHRRPTPCAVRRRGRSRIRRPGTDHARGSDASAMRLTSFS